MGGMTSVWEGTQILELKCHQVEILENKFQKGENNLYQAGQAFYQTPVRKGGGVSNRESIWNLTLNIELKY